MLHMKKTNNKYKQMKKVLALIVLFSFITHINSQENKPFYLYIFEMLVQYFPHPALVF